MVEQGFEPQQSGVQVLGRPAEANGRLWKRGERHPGLDLGRRPGSSSTPQPCPLSHAQTLALPLGLLAPGVLLCNSAG